MPVLKALFGHGSDVLLTRELAVKNPVSYQFAIWGDASLSVAAVRCSGQVISYGNPAGHFSEGGKTIDQASGNNLRRWKKTLEQEAGGVRLNIAKRDAIAGDKRLGIYLDVLYSLPFNGCSLMWNPPYSSDDLDG